MSINQVHQHRTTTYKTSSAQRLPFLLIHGRYDRMVPFEVSIVILNHIADWHLMPLNSCERRPPLEKPAERIAQILAVLKGYRQDGSQV